MGNTSITKTTDIHITVFVIASGRAHGEKTIELNSMSWRSYHDCCERAQ